MPTSREDPLAQQNIKDRFYGQEDPVAAKILNRSASLPELKPPDDPTITSLWLGGVDDSINEQDLRDVFYSFGEIASVRLVRKQQIAFVEYTSRPAAEAAAKALHNKLNVKGTMPRQTFRQSCSFGEGGCPHWSFIEEGLQTVLTSIHPSDATLPVLPSPVPRLPSASDVGLPPRRPSPRRHRVRPLLPLSSPHSPPL